MAANWQARAYVKAANADAGDNFGGAVAVDRDTVVVGAQYEDSDQTTITNGATASAVNSWPSFGAAYVYKRTGATWSQEAYLKASNADIGDLFGNSVALSGDTIAVGAMGEGSSQTTITNGATASADNSAASAGAVYIFKRAGATWAQEAYLKAPNSQASDSFGWSVAISGDTVVVGAIAEDSNQTTITNGTTASADNTVANSGAAYVYKRTGATWAQEAYLKAPNSNASDSFGISVSVSGDSLAVGANGEDSNQTTITNGTTASSDNTALGSGAVYVFKRTGAGWMQEAYIKAANAGGGDVFGQSVSLSGDTLVVGAPYEASSQNTISNGATASSDNSSIFTGAVYIYKRTGTNWAQEAYVKSPNSESGDSFGGSVSANGDSVVVGANFEDSSQTTITNGMTASSDNSASMAGAAYVFKRNGVAWAQESYIKAPNAGANKSFGSSVAVSGDTVVVGAPGEDSNQTTITNGATASSDNSATDAGAIYIFQR